MVQSARKSGISPKPPAMAQSHGFYTSETPTSVEAITHYNNFYEFSTDKEAVAEAAARFVARPWTIAVEGLVKKPRVFDLDQLLRLSPAEERIYRMRCVEGWSMVIPWNGFSLSRLLDAVEPLSGARFVAFQTLLDPSPMPNQRREVLEWPYLEGLRIDEAMHPLTLLATGLYGRALAPQNGAPLRLVVPWKYGFKGIKSIVKIKLVDKRPKTTWNAYAPGEYGFYANVNPTIDHPRWSQASERRIGEFGRRNADVQRLCRAGRASVLGMDLSGIFERMKDPAFSKLVVLVNGAVPLAMLGWDGLRHRLGADPIAFAIRTTGMLTILFLLLSLTVTPARLITGWNWLSHFRRMLGLYAFFYGVLHLCLYFVFDRSLSVGGTVADVVKRPFILFGMTALILMIPLAATSTTRMIKRLAQQDGNGCISLCILPPSPARCITICWLRPMFDYRWRWHRSWPHFCSIACSSRGSRFSKNPDDRRQAHDQHQQTGSARIRTENQGIMSPLL